MNEGERWPGRPVYFDTRLEIYDFVTPPVVTSLTRYFDWRMSLKGAGYNALIFLLLLAMSPFGLVDQHGYLVAAAILLMFVLIYTGVTSLLMLAWVFLHRSRDSVRIFRIPVGLGACTAATIVAFFHESLHSEHGFNFGAALGAIPFIFLLAQIFEAFFFIFAAPHLLAIEEAPKPNETEDGAVAEALDPDRSNETLAIAGRNLPLADTLHISSHGHYLRCLVGGKEIWLRGRLLDVLAQTVEADGFQPRRSWWVSANAVRELRRDASGDTLVLTDGVEIPIPRARRDDVRARVEGLPSD